MLVKLFIWLDRPDSTSTIQHGTVLGTYRIAGYY